MRAPSVPRILALVALTATSLAATSLAAQQLRDRLSELFIFSEGGEVLFLGGSGDPGNPETIRLHGEHFVPAAVESNASVIAFLTNSISGTVGNLPVSASSGGATFRFEAGAPVRTSISAGPVLGERAQTLGRGRLFLGLSRTGIAFRTLRGVPIDQLAFTFTHANVDFPNCDAIFGGDCSLLGTPTFENETIDLTLALELDLHVTSFLVTYGVSDRVDVGVVLPFVETSLRGRSEAQIIPFGGDATPPHFFAGTPDAPILTASRFTEGSASGLGDVAARIKVNLRHAEPVSLALLAEGRFPTGSEDDLLGSGGFSGRGLAIVSARFGDFSPHANVGYQYRGKDRDTDAFLVTAGFDQLLAPWATFAADLVSEFQVGTGRLRVPPAVVVEAPYRRTIRASTVPARRDDLINAALGIKLTAAAGLAAVANAAWPLNRGGLRPDVIWTVGLEYSL